MIECERCGSDQVEIITDYCLVDHVVCKICSTMSLDMRPEEENARNRIISGLIKTRNSKIRNWGFKK